MDAAAAAAQPSPIASFVPIIAIFLIFYFLVIRPQQKQMADHKKLLEGIKIGDRVITNGGLYGTVTALRGTDLEIKIADGVKVLITRPSVQKLANESELASTQSA
jgi:preprotein translocase subunit YajC